MHRVTDAQRQVAYYKRLLGLVAFFAEWEVLPFDQHAAVTFERLRQQRVRIGTMDLHDRIGGEYEVCGRERMAEGGGAERSASGGLSRARGGNMLR